MRIIKLTVIGGTGLVGSQVVQKLNAAGYDAVAAAPSTGVDVIRGRGRFLRTATNNLLRAGERAPRPAQVILSIVGVDQVPQLDYYRAKTLREDMLGHGSTPYSIVRATKFFGFMDAVLSETSDDITVRLRPSAGHQEHRRPGRKPGTHALPGLAPGWPVTARLRAADGAAQAHAALGRRPAPQGLGRLSWPAAGYDPAGPGPPYSTPKPSSGP